MERTIISTADTRVTTTLNEAESRFQLARAGDPSFFDEWLTELPALSAAEKSELDRVRNRFRYHRADGAIAEGVVNLMVLSPLLELAGLYGPPFWLRSEVPVELSVTVPASETEERRLRGRLDFLVVQQRLWLVVFESKGTALNLDTALPQTLTYMMANPNPEVPVYGMVSNGGEFVFLKLADQGTPQYDVSRVFSYLPTQNELYDVLKILKRFSSLIQMSEDDS